jgi:hypothetical protein
MTLIEIMVVLAILGMMWGHDYVYRLESGKPVVLSNGAGGEPLVACPDGCPAGYEATESREEAK